VFILTLTRSKILFSRPIASDTLRDHRQTAFDLRAGQKTFESRNRITILVVVVVVVGVVVVLVVVVVVVVVVVAHYTNASNALRVPIRCEQSSL